MIKNIIDVFERKFNIFADTANAFTSRFVRDEDSAIGTLCYRNFNVEFEYCLEYSGAIEKSGLNIIVDFSKRTQLPLKCMMYDIIGLLDKNNFNCWFYCFIENEERMELCFDKLSADFAEVFPKLRDFAGSADNLGKLEEVLKKNISNTIGIDSIENIENELDCEEDALDDVYDYLYSMYFGYQMREFATNEYRDFLSGDFKKALRRYQKKKHRLVYEDAICEYIISAGKSAPAITKEYECLKDGLKEYYNSSGFAPFAVSCGVLIVPFFVLSVMLYYAIALVLYSNSLYATALEWYNSLACILSALFGSMLAGYFLRERIYRRFFKKKYKKMMEYDAIFNTEKTEKKMKVFFYLVYILVLIFVFLSANCGVSLSYRGVQINKTIFDFDGSFYRYNEISLAECDEYNVKLYFDDGESIDMYDYAEINDLNEKFLPVLKENGVEIIQAENSTE